MAKSKAPTWLRESFRDGVDERDANELCLPETHPVESNYGCWLAQFDPTDGPCAGRLERFHYLSRQRVEHALGALLYNPHIARELVLLAAWDARNGSIGCEGHHRALDSHRVSLPAEQLVVPYDALPDHVIEFAEDWGLESELERKFPTKETVQ